MIRDGWEHGSAEGWLRLSTNGHWTIKLQRSSIITSEVFQSASTSIKRNTLINLTGSVLPILLSLVTVPVYLRLIGTARYGVLAIVWVLLGYFSFFDMGLGRAITNQVARLRHAPARDIEASFWTALLVNAVFGALGGGAMFLAGHVLLGTVFNIPPDLRSEALSALPWLAASVPLVTISSVLSGALEGKECFLISNIIGVVTTSLFQTVPVLVAMWHGPHLAWLIGSIVLIRAASGLWTLFACVKYLPLTGRPHFDTGRIGPLFRFGGWVTITGVIKPFLATLDQLVLGARTGVQSVPFYSIPYNLVTQALILPTSLSRTLFPRFSMLKGEAASVVGREACLGLAVVLTPISVAGMVMLKPFLELWVGPVLADTASPVGQILLIGIWFNSLAYIAYALLQGQGRPDLTAKLHMLELAPYILVLWVGVTMAGPQGAAWAWVLRAIVDAALLFVAARFPGTYLAPLITPAVLTVLASVASLLLFTDLALRISIGGSLIVMSTWWAWRAAPPELKLRLPGLRKGSRTMRV